MPGLQTVQSQSDDGAWPNAAYLTGSVNPPEPKQIGPTATR